MLPRWADDPLLLPIPEHTRGNPHLLREARDGDEFVAAGVDG